MTRRPTGASPRCEDLGPHLGSQKDQICGCLAAVLRLDGRILQYGVALQAAATVKEMNFVSSSHCDGPCSLLLKTTLFLHASPALPFSPLFVHPLPLAISCSRCLLAFTCSGVFMCSSPCTPGATWPTIQGKLFKQKYEGPLQLSGCECFST